MYKRQDPYQQTTEIDSSDTDWLGIIDDYTALPGFDEECFDCPEWWGWKTGINLNGNPAYIWVAPDGSNWYWGDSGWAEGPSIEPISNTSSTPTALFVGATSESDGPTYTDHRELPGWIEDCFECPPWGWSDVHDLSWIGPDGTQWFASMRGVWVTTDPADGEISNYKDLPGYIEECNECPPWGWIETEDGSWVWDGGLEVVWTFQFSSGIWQWMTEEGSYPHNDYKDLPNFDPDCHECPEWGWAPEGDIWYLSLIHI